MRTRPGDLPANSGVTLEAQGATTILRSSSRPFAPELPSYIWLLAAAGLFYAMQDRHADLVWMMPRENPSTRPLWRRLAWA